MLAGHAPYVKANFRLISYGMDEKSETFKKIDVVDAGEINVKQFDELLSTLKAGDEALPNEEEIKERQAIWGKA